MKFLRLLFVAINTVTILIQLGHVATESEDAVELGFAPVSGFVGGETYKRSYTLQVSGGGLSHNNMPPYLAVYVWQRIE